MMVKTQRGLSN